MRRKAFNDYKKWDGKRYSKKLLKLLKKELAKLEFGTIDISEIALDNGNMRGVWSSISSFMHADDKYHRMVILGFTGKDVSHWTCVTEISETKMELLDSGEMLSLNKEECSCGNDKKNKYCISTSEIWGISWK